ncbi:MAG: hypothetical protein KDD35_09700, partial [Bdellovibrionales bacterium]|nr:hypothetical protein [Bdellovibrionales bacterium]
MYKLTEDHRLKLYNMLSDEAIFGIMVFTSDDHHCLYANHLARELIEIPSQLQLENLSIQDLYPKKVRPEYRALSNNLLENEGFFQDVAVSKQNSTTFIANLGIRKIHFDEVSCISLMFQDITIQKKLQRDITTKQIEIKATFEELIKQNNQLKELDLAKNRFIALTTHELRTPLSAMV